MARTVNPRKESIEETLFLGIAVGSGAIDELIIVNSPIDEALEKKYSLQLLTAFMDDVIIKEEIYGLYILGDND